jgi:hypothetical protein
MNESVFWVVTNEEERTESECVSDQRITEKILRKHEVLEEGVLLLLQMSYNMPTIPNQ